MNKEEVIQIVDINSIPKNTLCVFAQKVPKGIRYILGYMRGDVIHVHFSQQRFAFDENIVTYQKIYNSNGRIIKK